MSFFKRISRSRTNSTSNDDDWDNPNSPKADKGYDHNLPPSSFKSSGNYTGSNPPASDNRDMYPRPSETQGYNNSPVTQQGRPIGNSIPSRTRDSGFVDSTPAPLPAKNGVDHAPDLLTRAFQEAVRPHTERIEQLEQQVADLQAWNDQLEQQRLDVFSWIDKRGLRPDVPPTVAKQMDSMPDAAPALNAQLDRKMTIVNFDLHRLQDDLNDNLSSSHFAGAMSKFLPEIQRLSMVPTGSRYAFELIIKLAGNLNSHGGVEPNGTNNVEVEEDRAARSQFYDRLDIEMEQIIRQRIAENEDWQIGSSIKRLEKNGAYLKNYGIDHYFDRSLDLMRREAARTQGAQGQPTQQRY